MKIKDKILARIFLCLGLLTSGVVTFLAYNKDGLTLQISVLVMASMILIMESGKGIAIITYVKTKHKSWLVMCILFIGFSIIGSMSYFIQKPMENEHAKLVFEETKGKKESLEAQIEYKKAEKLKIESDKNQAESSVSKDKDTYQENLKGFNNTIENLQKKLDTKNKELTSAISKKYAKTPAILKAEIKTLTETMNQHLKSKSELKQTDSSSVSSKEEKADKIDNEITALQKQVNSMTISESDPNSEISGIPALFEYLGIEWKFMEFLLTLLFTTTFETWLCMLYLYIEGISWRDLASKREVESPDNNSSILDSIASTVYASTSDPDTNTPTLNTLVIPRSLKRFRTKRSDIQESGNNKHDIIDFSNKHRKEDNVKN